MVSLIDQTMPTERRHEIEPWGARPGTKSRLSGVGGELPLNDASCVFETAGLSFEEGDVTLRVEVEGFSGEFAFMFLNLTNASVVGGSPQTRLQLTPMELHPEATNVQHCVLSFKAYRHIRYQLSGHIHGDNALSAARITIVTDQDFTVAEEWQPELAAISRSSTVPYVAGTRRLYDLVPANFEQLHSQPFTPGQLLHPAFVRLQEELYGHSGSPSALHWPEIFALRALETFGNSTPATAIGFDPGQGALCTHFLKRGCSVIYAERSFDPGECVDLGARRSEILAHLRAGHEEMGGFHHVLIGDALPPEFCGNFDFAWWIGRAGKDVDSVSRGILNIAGSIKPGGVGVAVFPMFFGGEGPEGALSANRDLPRIVIDLLSFGHRIVQVRFPPAGMAVPGLVDFGLVILGSQEERGGHDAPADGDLSP